MYDLKKHTKFAFRPGSVVKQVPTQPQKLGQVIDSCPQVCKLFTIANTVKIINFLLGLCNCSVDRRICRKLLSSTSGIIARSS